MRKCFCFASKQIYDDVDIQKQPQTDLNLFCIHANFMHKKLLNFN